MLALSVLAARHALRGPAAKRGASTVARVLGNNATLLSTRFDRLQVSRTRGFSTIEGPDDDDQKTRSLQDAKQDQDEDHDHFKLHDEDQDVLKAQDEDSDGQDGELSPLERLMLHSQQFELDQEDQEKDSEQAEKSDEEQDGPMYSSWGDEGSRPSSTTKDYRTPAAFRKNTFRRRGSSVHHSNLGRLAVDQLLEKDMDELNYEAELENVWDKKELKQRKFHQALRRELDRDRVCTNCGERGHRSRNCLLPRLCSNCGNLGHTAPECRFRRNPDTVDEFLEREQDLKKQRKQGRKLRSKAAEAAKDPGMPRLEEIPTSDFNKRNESLRKELDAELEEFAVILEERSQKRKESIAAKEKAKTEKEEQTN